MSTPFPLPDERPEPVLEAAKVTKWVGLGGPLLVALLTSLAGLTVDEANAGLTLGTGAVLAGVGLVNYVVATVQARKARAEVTPLAAPVDEDGTPLVPAARRGSGYSAGEVHVKIVADTEDFKRQVTEAAEHAKQAYVAGLAAPEADGDAPAFEPDVAAGEPDEVAYHPASTEREVDLARREVRSAKRALVDAEYEGDPDRVAEAKVRHVAAVERLEKATGAVEAKPAEPVVAQDALLDEEGNPIS